MTGPTLLISDDSRAWRRQFGPTAWAALEHLALAAQADELGWAAPVGVRDVAAGLGVTKDTAARAVAALTAAGLVTRTRVETLGGRHRSGYRLHLPEPLQLSDRPVHADGLPHNGTASPPEGEYEGEAEAGPNSIPIQDSGIRGGLKSSKRTLTSGDWKLWVEAQPTLFDNPTVTNGVPMDRTEKP